MAFWSGERLVADAKLLGIVDPYDPSKVDCSAYTLTLGPEVFVTPDYALAAREITKKTLTAPAEVELGGGRRNLEGGEVVIPPGQFALLLTEEFVHIPDHAMGFISLKFSVKGPGLINVSGFHVDPGFRGRLIFSVYNAGPSPAHLNRGQDVFLLWIADLDQKSEGRFVKPPTDVPQMSIPSKMISQADRPIHSLQQLSDKIRDLDNELTIFKRVVTIIAAIVTLLVAATGVGITVWRTVGAGEAENSISRVANVTG